MSPVLYGIVALCLVVGVGFGIWQWKSNKPNSADNGGLDIKALEKELANLKIVKLFRTLTGEARNIGAYAETKVASIRVAEIVDAVDKPDVQAAYDSILAKIAKAHVMPVDSAPVDPKQTA